MALDSHIQSKICLCLLRRKSMSSCLLPVLGLHILNKTCPCSQRRMSMSTDPLGLLVVVGALVAVLVVAVAVAAGP